LVDASEISSYDKWKIFSNSLFQCGNTPTIFHEISIEAAAITFDENHLNETS